MTDQTTQIAGGRPPTTKGPHPMTQATATATDQTLNKGLSLTNYGQGCFDSEEQPEQPEGLLAFASFDEGDEAEDAPSFNASRQPAQGEERWFTKRTTRTTATVRLFPYGGGWRVQYERTSNDRGNSRLLACQDEEYMPYPPVGRERYRDGEYREACRQAFENAEKAYRQIVVAMGGAATESTPA